MSIMDILLATATEVDERTRGVSAPDLEAEIEGVF